MDQISDGHLEGPTTASTSRRASRLSVVAIFLVAVAASAVLTWLNRDVYAFLFGNLNLLLLTAATGALGAGALQLLVAYDWFHAGASGRNVATAIGLGCSLTLPVIIVDLLGGFPAEMNVRFPESLLFYPAIALVAESVFHLVPLALLASVWRMTRFELARARLLAIGAVALIEPMLQVALGAGQSPLWTNIFLGFYVLGVNLIALDIFRRSGFVALYALRLGYYFIWHIAWGHLRLPLLFGGEV